MKKAKGFTLLELMVVLVVIGVLMAVVKPSFDKYGSDSRNKAAKMQIEHLSGALNMYRLELGRYPAKLNALIEAPSDSKNWNGPYLDKGKIPQDPWENDYQYEFPGTHGKFDLLSLGEDGLKDTEDDIVSWE